MLIKFNTIALVGVVLATTVLPFSGQAKTWQNTTAAEGLTAGVSLTDNTAAMLFKLDHHLYAVTDNDSSAVQLASYNPTDVSWDPLSSSGGSWDFLDDDNSIGVTAKLQFKKKVYLAFENTVTGAELWRVNSAGATQVNVDGFGRDDIASILQLIDFNDRVLAFAQLDSGAVAVYGQPDDGSTTWELMTTVDGEFAQGLDAAAVFKGTIYLANRYPAQVYTSTDGYHYTYTTTFDDDFDYQQISAFQVINHLLIALGTANRFCYEDQQEVRYTSDGAAWTLDTSRPEKAFCYTQVVPKPDSATAYYLGFDSADAVAYKNSGTNWVKQTAEGFIADDTDSFETTENREFSDGIWYQGDIYLATVNTTNGTQIWSKQ